MKVKRLKPARPPVRFKDRNPAKDTAGGEAFSPQHGCPIKLKHKLAGMT